jgi:hypothetical protein
VKQNLTFIHRCFYGIRDLPGCERNNKRGVLVTDAAFTCGRYASSRQGLMLSPCMGSWPNSLVCLDSTNAAGECRIKQTTLIQPHTTQVYCNSVGHLYMCYMFRPVPRPSPGTSIQEPTRALPLYGSGIDITDDGLSTGRNMQHTRKCDQLHYNKPVLCQTE